MGKKVWLFVVVVLLVLALGSSVAQSRTAPGPSGFTGMRTPTPTLEPFPTPPFATPAAGGAPGLWR